MVRNWCWRGLGEVTQARGCGSGQEQAGLKTSGTASSPRIPRGSTHQHSPQGDPGHIRLEGQEQRPSLLKVCYFGV